MKKTLATVAAAALIAAASPGAAAAIEAPQPISIVDATEIEKHGLADLRDLLEKVPQVPSYRYGDNPRGDATLPRDFVPAATPDYIGAAGILPGDEGWDLFIETLRVSSKLNEFEGDGLVDGEPYVWFFSSRGEPAKSAFGAEEYYAQVDWVIGVDGLKGWKAGSAFPGDTYQGASLVASAYWAPNSPFDFSLYESPNFGAPIEFDGAYFLGEDWTAVAIDKATLDSYGTELSFGFASHVHDGSYGSCRTCESIVTAYPGTPRKPAELYPITAQLTLDATPEPTTTESPAAAASSGGGIPWWVILIPIAIVAAFVFLGMRKSKPIPDACKDEKAALDTARSQRQARQELVDNAEKSLADREAFAAGLKAQQEEIVTAMRGPRGGMGDGDFARIDGRLIKYDDLAELSATVTRDLKDAQAEVKREKAELAARKRTLKAAQKTEADAKQAFDACMKEHAPG